MASDELYKLAVEYNKQKLWHKMDSDQIFGFKLADGRIVYCSVQGRHGEEDCALSVYIETEKLDRLRHSEMHFGEISENEMFLLNVSQDCLRLVLDVKDALVEEELKAEKDFSKRNKIYFRAKYSHPRFLKFTPLSSATMIESLEDEKILAQAISATLEVAKKFPDKLPRRIQFLGNPPFRRKFPLLTFDGENYKWTMENLPPFRLVKYPAAKLKPADLKKLSAAKKSGSYSCEIFAVPRTEYEGELSKFPVKLMTFNRSKKREIEIESALDYVTAPEILTAEVAKSFLEHGVPKKIFVRNERTYIFLEKFCEQTGIELLDADDLPEMDDLEENFLRELEIDSFADNEDVLNLLNYVENESVEELRKTLPQDIKDFLQQLYEDDILSEEMDAKLEKILFDD